VRPEDLKVDTKGDGLKVDVDVVEELGADGYLYGHTEIDGQRVDIVVRTDGRSHPNAGDKIVITPVPAHVHTFDTETGERLSDVAIAASTTAAGAAAAGAAAS
jgi:multiple sugar transport system ATP-binding protein